MRNILIPAGLLVGLTLLVTLVVAGAPKPDTRRTASQEVPPTNPCAVQTKKAPANPCAPVNPCAVPRASN